MGICMNLYVLRYLARRQRKLQVLRYLARQLEFLCALLPGTAAKEICMCFDTWHGGEANMYVLRYLSRRHWECVCASLHGTAAMCFISWHDGKGKLYMLRYLACYGELYALRWMRRWLVKACCYIHLYMFLSISFASDMFKDSYSSIRASFVLSSYRAHVAVCLSCFVLAARTH
jgi:hypothetical protein